eukprot:3607473-Prymnesium_polylepis.1
MGGEGPNAGRWIENGIVTAHREGSGRWSLDSKNGCGRVRTPVVGFQTGLSPHTGRGPDPTRLVGYSKAAVWQETTAHGSSCWQRIPCDAVCAAAGAACEAAHATCGQAKRRRPIRGRGLEGERIQGA